jgi:hypothetical protein
MTIPQAVDAGPIAVTSEAVRSLDGFTALNPADGLFLRAEHLQAIQAYAAALALANGAATGPGVVHGLDVVLSEDEKSLRIASGLAISPTGQLLQSHSPIVVPLDAAHLTALPHDGFWVVDLVPASDTSGSAPVYGSLCNDGCSEAGSTIRPWLDIGVAVQLTPDSVDDLEQTAAARRRNWLASAYFERERKAGPPWLVPGVPDQPVGSLLNREWGDGTTLPKRNSVPLAVLQEVSGHKVLDQWTARRLVDGSAAQATWRSRLAMRPWSVFLAQVLQLEHELAEAATGSGIFLHRPEKLMVVDVEVEVENPLRGPVEEYVRHYTGKSAGKTGPFHELEAAVEKAGNLKGTYQTVRSLTGLGLVELPPAGYLSVDEHQKDLPEILQGFFGDLVDLRLCSVRADQVGDAVEAAQHRDRIPLMSELGHPEVDVLVPLRPADKAELSTGSYGWVAFVRRPASCREERVPDPVPERDPVTVFVAKVGQGEENPEKPYSDGKTGKAEEFGDLDYPAGEWQFPAGSVPAKVLDFALREEMRGIAVVIGLASSDERRALASVRASLFAASLDSGFVPPPVHAFTSAEGREAIIVVFWEQG